MGIWRDLRKNSHENGKITMNEDVSPMKIR